MRSSEWDVVVDGGSQQGTETFAEAVGHVAEAALAGSRWDVRVRGPRDSAFRYLTTSETATLIAAVTQEMSK